MTDKRKQWLREFLSEKVEGIHMTDEIDIFEAGLLDSMGLIEMVSAIEEQFKIELSSAHLQDSRFKTIQGIAQIIEEEIPRSTRDDSRSTRDDSG